MCGIAGGWIKGSRADATETVERAVAALFHRGPDDGGVAAILPAGSDDQIIFGARRLAIIDLSEAGHQPMRDPETGNWIAYNGEVYNFPELREDLKARGCRFRSSCDTEVILKSYAAWGRDCVRRWRGMFAAAIWDAHRRELFIARDRLGIKPLYYRFDQAGFLFASELRALLAMIGSPGKINISALDTYLMFGAVQDPFTLIDGVMAVPAAHSLTIRAGGFDLQEYWDLPTERGDEASDDHRVIERIAERLEEAVRLRLISDVPLGLFMSGGIDSSALALLMKRCSPDQIKSFTISFPQKNFDEAQQAKRTANHLGVEHRSILLSEQEMLSSCVEAMEAIDQPSIDGINTFHVSQAVKRAGITVALSGLGGDEAFGGYSHFRALPRIERAEKLLARVPFVARNLAANTLASNRSDKSAKLRALLAGDYGFAHPYFLARTLFLPRQIASLLEPEAARAIDYGAWGTRLRQVTKRAQKLDPINRVSYLELKTYIANTLLRDADVMSMAHSLEVRVPFLDHLLLEEVMRVPGRIKLDSKIPKPLLVRSLPELLPREVIAGPKKGFTLPFAVWLPNQLRASVEASFNAPPPALDGIIDAESVRAVWRAFLDGRCSWTRPWSLFVLFQSTARLFKQTDNRREACESGRASIASPAVSV